MRRSVLTGVLASLACGLGPVPVAAARAPDMQIVAFQSIAGVSLGATPGRVRAQLGRPSSVLRVRGRVMELAYDRRGLVIDFADEVRGDPVDNIVADGPRYRTARGIHVGSSLAATRHAYGRMRCGLGICTLVRGRPGVPGARTLTFVFVAGRIESVQVGETFAHRHLPIMFRRT